jgi:hypothetical protein
MSAASGENVPECGAVAQLGERRVRNAEVGGSIPLGSTTFRSGRCLGGSAAERLAGWGTILCERIRIAVFLE